MKNLKRKIYIRFPFPLNRYTVHLIPTDLIDKEMGKKYNWVPLAHTEETKKYLQQLADETNIPMGPIPSEIVVATVLRLSRNLA